jgi:hypothetical protein
MSGSVNARSFMEAHRGKLIAGAVLLALVGVGHLARRLDIPRLLYGRGYLPYVKLEWKAKQAASKLGRPLVTLTVDPRHPMQGRLEELAKDPVIEHLIDRFVWYRVEVASTDPTPASPVMSVRGSSGEAEIVAPWVVDAALTPGALAELLKAAEKAHGVEPAGS